MRRPHSAAGETPLWLCTRSRRTCVRIAVVLWAVLASVTLWFAAFRQSGSSDAVLDGPTNKGTLGAGRPQELYASPDSIGNIGDMMRNEYVNGQGNQCSPLADPQVLDMNDSLEEANLATLWWWQHYLGLNQTTSPNFVDADVLFTPQSAGGQTTQYSSQPFRFAVLRENDSCLSTHRLIVASLQGSDQGRCNPIRNAMPKFTTDLKVDALVRSSFGPEHFEATVITPGHSAKPLFFAFDAKRCLYYTQQFHAEQGSVFLVDHLHTDWNAWRETVEEAHYDYVMQRISPLLSPPSALMCGQQATGKERVCVLDIAFDREVAAWTASRAVTPVGCRAAAGHQLADASGGWVSRGKDPSPLYHQSVLKGYWLTFKGMQWKSYSKIPQYELDILGRMNFGESYSWSPGQRRAGTMNRCLVKSLCRTRECILELLRDRTIYFFGDSHMRIFFYGFLSRLGVPYPLDKVWRGDRTDVIASHNVTVKFVASYFLNFSRPSAEGMMTDGTGPIVVAGVGQHHSCHCWSLEKHMAVVRASLCDLTTSSDVRAPCVDLSGNMPSSENSKWRHLRHVVWFGIPAQPYNSHLYRRKPVGQSRKDCRNNGRHLLYSAFQRAAVERVRRRLAGGGSTLHFLDSYAMSLGMQHTSLDGAHYYTWAREAWIDALVDIIHAKRLLR